MISLEQIRLLENKVHKAVSLLAAVSEENKILKTRLAEYEQRIDDLEFKIEEFKDEQSEIEQGIISALNHLDTLEDAVGGLKGQTALPAENKAKAAPEPAVEAKSPSSEKPEPFSPEIDAIESEENEGGPSLADQPDEPDDEEIATRDQQLDIF